MFIQSVSDLVCVCVCVFGEEGNCNWGEVVTVASGAGTDAQELYLKQVDSQMGKVSNNHVFFQPLLGETASLWWRSASRHGNDKLLRKGGGRAKSSSDGCWADFHRQEFRPEVTVTCLSCLFWDRKSIFLSDWKCSHLIQGLWCILSTPLCAQGIVIDYQGETVLTEVNLISTVLFVLWSRLLAHLNTHVAVFIKITQRCLVAKFPWSHELEMRTESRDQSISDFRV